MDEFNACHDSSRAIVPLPKLCPEGRHGQLPTTIRSRSHQFQVPSLSTTHQCSLPRQLPVKTAQTPVTTRLAASAVVAAATAVSAMRFTMYLDE